jgi:transcriptional regulator with XRE-family HTH domain
MVVSAIKMAGVGKKRAKVTARKGDALSVRFGARLAQLLGNRPASYLAEKLKVSPDAVLKWMRGQRTPSIDDWDAIAQALGLASYRDLIP